MILASNPLPIHDRLNLFILVDKPSLLNRRSEDGDSSEPLLEELPSPQPEISSDDEPLEPQSQVATPAKPSIYELNTRRPPPRSAKKDPPSVIKVQSRRDSTGRKVSPETEVGGSMQVGEDQGADGTGGEVTSAKPDIYALNMKPPPNGGRKKAGGAGGGRRTRRAVKTEDEEEEVPMPRVKRSRAAKTKLTSAESEDDVSEKSEGAGGPALALALRPRRAAAAAARGRLTSLDEGSDVSMEESELKFEETADEARQTQGRGRGRGRLRKVGERMSDEESLEADVKPEVKEEVLGLEDRGNIEGAYEPVLEREPKSEPEDDIKPDVGEVIEKGNRRRRKTRGEPVAVKEEVKEEESDDLGPVERRVEGVTAEKGLDRHVTRQTGVEDERSLRTRALFTRKRDTAKADTSREIERFVGVRVKDEPVSQINGPDLQVAPEERFDGHVAEPEWGREDGEGNAARDSAKLKEDERARRASENVSAAPFREANLDGPRVDDGRGGELGASDPAFGTRLAEGASRVVGQAAEDGLPHDETPKKKRKVNFRAQMKELGL